MSTEREPSSSGVFTTSHGDTLLDVQEVPEPRTAPTSGEIVLVTKVTGTEQALIRLRGITPPTAPARATPR